MASQEVPPVPAKIPQIVINAAADNGHNSDSDATTEEIYHPGPVRIQTEGARRFQHQQFPRPQPQRHTYHGRRGPVRFVHEDSDSATEDGNGDDGSDLVSVTSSELPDRRYWPPFAADADTKVVYESWELLDMDDSYEYNTWKSFLGIRFGKRWTSMDDGFSCMSPIYAHTQEELAAQVAAAELEHDSSSKKGKKKKSYEQDLADRAYGLSEAKYNRLQRLVNSKWAETNRNPHRVRVWTVVLLKEEEQAITRLNPDRTRKGLRPWVQFWKSKDELAHRTAMDRWVVVLKGEETRVLDKPWGIYGRSSNPWAGVDRMDNQEDVETRRAGREKRDARHLVERRDRVRRGR